MGTPASERQRRSRAHRKDDHRWCDPKTCDGVTAGVTAAVAVPGVTAAVAVPVEAGSGRVPGGIETMARAFVESLPYLPDDPRFLLGEVAVQLARRVDEDGAVPAAVRELRVLLMQLAEAPNGPAGKVDELRVRRAQRRLDGILAAHR